MVRRPIIWGLIFFGIGAVGWFFSVILAVITLGKLSWLANFFGWFAAGSLISGAVWELILWIKNPPSRKASEGKGKNDITN